MSATGSDGSGGYFNQRLHGRPYKLNTQFLLPDLLFNREMLSMPLEFDQNGALRQSSVYTTGKGRTRV